MNGANVGFGYASFLLGLVDQVQISNPTRPRMGKKQLGIYAQDTWKVTRKFTLDYGLRYDYSTYLQGTVRPRSGIFSGRDPSRRSAFPAPRSTTAPVPAVATATSRTIIRRRLVRVLGCAYQITPKTVFRAGFGIVYSGTASNNNAAGGLAGSPRRHLLRASAFPSRRWLKASRFIPAGAWPSYDSGLFPDGSARQHVVTPGPGRSGWIPTPDGRRGNISGASDSSVRSPRTWWSKSPTSAIEASGGRRPGC